MKKILVATDGSADADKAVARAIETAKREGAEIVVVNVAEDWCPIGLSEVDCSTITDLVMKEARGIMAAALDKFNAAGLEAKGFIETGTPAETILDIANREMVDEIIVASHGKHGAKKLVMGSVTSRLVEWATCPVVVVK